MVYVKYHSPFRNKELKGLLRDRLTIKEAIRYHKKKGNVKRLEELRERFIKIDLHIKNICI